MKRSLFAYILLLCLLTGCSTAHMTGQPEQPASVLPRSTSSQEASAAPPEPASDALAVLQATTEPPSPDQSSEPQPSADLPEQLDQIFSGNSAFTGSVLIASGGETLLHKSYGMANTEKDVKNTTDTKFLIGSVTKQFTAMAVMQLYEKEQLDIHDKLSSYIPDFLRGGDITLWNLLTQTSGITDYMNDEPILISKIAYNDLSERHIISLIQTKPLKFEPGSKYSYSNTNYLILGYIVEEISGLSYSDYLAQNILEPLGMKNTGVFDIGHPPENVATGYTRYGAPVCYYTADGGIDADKAGSVMGSYGAGCLYSTVGDLYLWDQALSTEKLVSKTYINMMLNPSVPVPSADPECFYGFGWVIENDPDVGTVCRHTGILSGFRAYNGIFADKGITVIILYNIKEFTGRVELIPALKQALK